MPFFTTNAIVIRSHHYGESDKIVPFFTKDFGKLKGIAKGARRSKKRFQNALDLFSHLRLIFFDREGMGLVRAQGCDILKSFTRIREGIKKIRSECSIFGFFRCFVSGPISKSVLSAKGTGTI